jgi:AcrR family transcriptional regulator
VGTKERRTRERHETREKILGAAREMFAEDGYDAVTMRAIADRIEYTPTAIYHHFENKQALFTELCAGDFLELAHHFRGQALPDDPIERIKVVGRAYIEFAEKYPSQYRFMFMTIMPQPELSPEYMQETYGNPEHDAYAFLRRACQEAIDSRRLRSEIRDADQLAQILWGTVHGLVSLRIVKKHDTWVPWRDLRESIELSMDTQLRGMLRDSSGKP